MPTRPENRDRHPVTTIPRRPRTRHATGPTQLTDLDTWTPHAACRAPDIDPEWFFPTSHTAAVQATAICAGCPVTAQCLTHALENGWLRGIWGGTSRRERNEIRKNPAACVPETITRKDPQCPTT